MKFRKAVCGTPVGIHAGPFRGAVIDKYPAIRGILRVECNRKQAPFIIRRIEFDHPVPDVKEWLVDHRAVHEKYFHKPALVREKEPAGPIMGRCDVDGG